MFVISECMNSSLLFSCTSVYVILALPVLNTTLHNASWLGIFRCTSYDSIAAVHFRACYALLPFICSVNSWIVSIWIRCAVVIGTHAFAVAPARRRTTIVCHQAECFRSLQKQQICLRMPRTESSKFKRTEPQTEHLLGWGLLPSNNETQAKTFTLQTVYVHMKTANYSEIFGVSSKCCTG
jgi:hypothetical protein